MTVRVRVRVRERDARKMIHKYEALSIIHYINTHDKQPLTSDRYRKKVIILGPGADNSGFISM